MELLIVLIILLIAVTIMAIKLNDGGLAFPFKKRTTLFTQVERQFMELLELSVGHQYRVICRVRLTDILDVRQNTAKRTIRTAMQRASGRHLDFVLCSKQDMTPIVAIDLVHHKGDGYKTQRDWFVAGALDAARIPHLRIKVKQVTNRRISELASTPNLHPFALKSRKNPLLQAPTTPTKKRRLHALLRPNQHNTIYPSYVVLPLLLQRLF